jgi:hypothetical protein
MQLAATTMGAYSNVEGCSRVKVYLGRSLAMTYRSGVVVSAFVSFATLMASGGCSGDDDEFVRIVKIDDGDAAIMSSVFFFRDRSGREVAQSEREGNTIEARLPEGGSVSWQYVYLRSPQVGYHTAFVGVDQVEPGDEIAFSGKAVLPEGCTCHYAADAPPDVEVDVRVRAGVPSTCPSPPCPGQFSSTWIDGKAELEVGEFARFISCESLGYDDLRPYAKQLRCPVF